MTPPVKKEVTVPLSPQAAFDLFTDGMDSWWPRTGYKGTTNQQRKIRFATHKGGEIVEEAEDGKRTIWGHVIAYDPGRFLAFTWFPEMSRDDATVVTITFTQTPDGTLCEVTHGTHDILGDLADAVSSVYWQKWDLVLGAYCAAAQRPTLNRRGSPVAKLNPVLAM